MFDRWEPQLPTPWLADPELPADPRPAPGDAAEHARVGYRGSVRAGFAVPEACGDVPALGRVHAPRPALLAPEQGHRAQLCPILGRTAVSNAMGRSQILCLPSEVWLVCVWLGWPCFGSV